MVIEPFACFIWCLLLLTLPLRWLLAAFLAASFHEMCHLTVLLILGYRPGMVRIGPTGIQMDIPELPYGYEFLCTAAGPLGSFLLLLFRHVYPQLSICALFQSVFNLLPVYPLDGGRMLRCVSLMIFPQTVADIICSGVSAAVLFTAVSIVCSLGYGKTAILVFLFLLLTWAARKIPCKPRHLRVQ